MARNDRSGKNSDGSFSPIIGRIPRILHGGDYNPDQWLAYPDILAQDLKLMKEASCNAMSIGIFSWTALEPEEGKYTFGWLDRVMDDLHSNGIYAVLATPSGARPAWLSAAYPEVLRVTPTRARNLHGLRHNHCYTSPIYREKTRIINTKLAERYKDHPALALWHVSNEYGGECHCELCQGAFRAWLRDRYHDSLDELNHAWWTAFWSHTFTSWEQIESPSPNGENMIHGMNLDWKRFVTHQTRSFIASESEPLRRITPDVPITTNFMGTYPGLDYFRFRDDVDVVSWDSYPSWHGVGEVSQPLGKWDAQGRDYRLAADIAFVHDLTRSIKGGKPFMLMESTPSVTNWCSVAKLKRPGMHSLSSLQAVAHGSDSVQYFQWRKSRGASEKFHGAVVDHEGSSNTRAFQDVAALGRTLGKLEDIVGSCVDARVAIVFDWENRWAIEDAHGPRNDNRKAYEETVMAHHLPFWTRGIATDVIDSECDFEGYDLVVAPMLYMLKPGVSDRLTAFVSAGGTLVATYLSGIADEHDLCVLGGFPGGLRNVLGIWSEEIDSLYPSERVPIECLPGRGPNMYGSYEAREFCDLIHLESASAFAEYRGEFYSGRPAATVNKFGGGEAYYLAARTDERFLDDFYGRICENSALKQAVPVKPPVGVSAQVRRKGEREFVFIMNFNSHAQTVQLGEARYTDVLSDRDLLDSVTLEGYGATVLVRSAR